MVGLIIPFHRGGAKGLDKFPKSTLLVNGKARILTQVLLTLKAGFQNSAGLSSLSITGLSEQDHPKACPTGAHHPGQMLCTQACGQERDSRAARALTKAGPGASVLAALWTPWLRQQVGLLWSL